MRKKAKYNITTIVKGKPIYQYKNMAFKKIVGP